MPNIKKKFLRLQDGYEIYTVDEDAIRNISLCSEEFTNWGIHEDIRLSNLIPEDEVWVSEEYNENEREKYIETAITVSRSVKSGMSFNDAYNNAIEKEREERELENQTNCDNVPDKVYVRSLGDIVIDEDEFTLSGFLVDGDFVRDHFKTDFVEGAHGYVFPWIPKDEVWIESNLKEEDVRFVMFHEVFELLMMRDFNMPYERAHDMAALEEFKLRNKKGEIDEIITELKKKIKKIKVAKTLVSENDYYNRERDEPERFRVLSFTPMTTRHEGSPEDHVVLKWFVKTMMDGKKQDSMVEARWNKRDEMMWKNVWNKIKNDKPDENGFTRSHFDFWNKFMYDAMRRNKLERDFIP